MKNIKTKSKNKVFLGEAIRVWISMNGSLDLDVPEEEIIKFYNSTLDGRK